MWVFHWVHLLNMSLIHFKGITVAYLVLSSADLFSLVSTRWVSTFKIWASPRTLSARSLLQQLHLQSTRRKGLIQRCFDGLTDQLVEPFSFLSLTPIILNWMADLRMTHSNYSVRCLFLSGFSATAFFFFLNIYLLANQSKMKNCWCLFFHEVSSLYKHIVAVKLTSGTYWAAISGHLSSLTFHSFPFFF